MKTGERIYSAETRTTYTITESFKAGGQAEVGFARSDTSERQFFIKKLLSVKYSERPAQQRECEQFFRRRREVYRRINSLTMPGGACSYVFDFFREKAFYYVVTERIVAPSYSPQEIAACLTPAEKLLLLKIIAQSMMPLEKGGIVHSDMKPDNIILKKVGDHLVAKLIDFESAFLADDPPVRGYVVGTASYYSPELYEYNLEEDEPPVPNWLTPKSDVFALGVIFYELLCGCPPTPRETPAFEVVRAGKALHMPAEWPAALRNLIASMTRKEPSQRPGIAQIVAQLKTVSPWATASEPEVGLPKAVVNRKSATFALLQLQSLTGKADIVYSLDKKPEQVYNGRPICLREDAELSMYASVQQGARRRTSPRVSLRVELTEKHGKVARPLINVTNGTITMTCKTPDVSIFYTTDGSKPSKHSLLYTRPLRVTRPTTIRAFATRADMNDSEVAGRNTGSTIRMT